MDRNRDMENRVALVTGAASGIGLATAQLLLARGARVMLADVDCQGLERVCAGLCTQYPGAVTSCVLDVTDESAWCQALESILAHWQRLDCLVNAAGIADESPVVEQSLARWRRVFSVNLDGAFLGLHVTLPALQKGIAPAVVNVASLSGLKPSAGAAAYCSSKAALIQLTKVAALECTEANSPVRVNCVAPGGVKTPMWERTPFWPDITTSPEWIADRNVPPGRRFAEADEVAAVIVFLCSSEASYLSGAVLPVDGGAQ